MPKIKHMSDSEWSSVDDICRCALKTYLLDPIPHTGEDLGQYYSNLAHNSGILDCMRAENAPKSELDNLLGYTLDCLRAYEMQSGWHVLSTLMLPALSDYLLKNGLAGRYVLEQRDEYLIRLYSYSHMFKGFIDKREDCVFKFLESGIIKDTKDYFPLF